MILALNTMAVSIEFQEPGLQAMALDILLGSDKLVYSLNRIQILLLEIKPD